MKYGNEMGVCQNMECATAEPRQTVTEVMFATVETGAEIGALARQIERSLFGLSREGVCCEEKKASPECFDDLLRQHRENLYETARVLEKIFARLGG